MADSTEPKVIGHFNAMTSALDLDMRFSEARCNKVLPIATRTYQEGAPSHYTSTVHASRVSMAMSYFMASAVATAMVITATTSHIRSHSHFDSGTAHLSNLCTCGSGPKQYDEVCIIWFSSGFFFHHTRICLVHA